MARVETVTDLDLPELLPLIRAYCEFYEVEPTHGQLLHMSRALIEDPANNGVQFIGRSDEGNPIGFATVVWSWATTSGGRQGIMHDLFVTPEARGTGIAAKLIERCTQAAENHGAVALIWQTAPDNYRAQRLYDRTGATHSTWLEYAIELDGKRTS